MATFKMRFSLLQEELPKLILLMTQRSPSANHGFLRGVARSNRSTKNLTSIRIPIPAPNAISL